jgi:tetratricopeptide (TPR) repeat protein
MLSFAAPPADDNRLKAGTRVTLVGFKAESMNGLVGTILHLDGERYVVRLNADDKSIKVKPCNLIATCGNNPSLEQLWVKADALTDQGRHEQAYLLYHQMYERLLVTRGEDHQCNLMIMYNVGMSLSKQDRGVEAHATFEKVLERQLRVLGCEHPFTLMTMSRLGCVLLGLHRFDEALVVYEALLPRQVRIHGEDHDDTLDTMNCMACVLSTFGRFDEAHRIASRGLLLARNVGNEEAAAGLVDTLSGLEQILGGKGEQKKKSSEPAGGTDGREAAESGYGSVKACGVCMPTVKTKACSGCEQVFYVSWI